MKLTDSEVRQYRLLLIDHVIKPCMAAKKVEGSCVCCGLLYACPNSATLRAINKSMSRKKHGPTPAREQNENK